MKKIILCSFLVAICLILETSATCDFNGHVLQIGEKATDSGCVQITCISEGSIMGIGCATVECAGEEISPPEQDLSKPYPECCPILHCRI